MISETPRTRPARPTEQDINRFVTRFYAEVRRDPELGPIFDERIPARHAHYLVLPASGGLSREVATMRDWLLANHAALP